MTIFSPIATSLDNDEAAAWTDVISIRRYPEFGRPIVDVVFAAKEVIEDTNHRCIAKQRAADFVPQALFFVGGHAGGSVLVITVPRD